jgi:hypothetical protein
MARIRTLTLLAALTGTLVVVAPSNAALPKLTGTVGPGFTITLKRLGKPFKTLKAGTYSVTVTDRSNIHNFHLRGPGVNKHRHRLQRREDGRGQVREGQVHVRL